MIQERRLLNKLEHPITAWPVNGFNKTLAQQTRRAYDLMADLYPLSTFFFHSRAHERAVELAGIENGMRILEVATGSGEMFQRLLRANPKGQTVGVDLSPNMAARTQRHARRSFPGVRAHCQAVDARQMPFPDGLFDAVVCCYLLELLAAEDIVTTVSEFRRILRRNGTLALVLIGQNTQFFNQLYKVVTKVAPAFWGRQVETRVPELIEAADFRITRSQMVKQSGYPSRILIARK
jgi:ubiquinone/menaquinone biosynthesis C-methylase UbiE